jgi:hypothetical protein
VKESLAGFLPYVFGTWGGPWQSVRLRATGAARFNDVWVRGDAGGRVFVEVTLDGPLLGAEIAVTVQDQGGNGVAADEFIVPAGATEARGTLQIREATQWSPRTPALYSAEVTLSVSGEVSDRWEDRFGCREVAVEGCRVHLNGEPIYLRGALSWGWYPEVIAPNPSAEMVSREFEQIQALGFNMTKACLWVPPREYLEAADAAGVMVWMELPLWLPEMSPAFRDRAVAEYERLLRQTRRHPSVVVWTLGCELQRNVDAAFLEELYALARRLTGSPLIRDNSGSGECYGGLLREYADFADYHFYCEPPMFRGTVDYFLPKWRPAQPWLFGEYADCDTFRDLPAIAAANEGETPWWALADAERNPQGVRWEYGITEQMARLEAHGLTEHRAALTRGSRLQAELLRKLTLEATRGYAETAGYVVTGWRDTPISTAGMIDDFEALKFSPETFHRFNADTVLLLGFDRRRMWENGGDRPSFLDGHNLWAGGALRAHIGVSHFGGNDLAGELEWSLADSAGPIAGGRERTRPVQPGELRELWVVEAEMPEVERPLQLALRVRLGGVENEWPFWVWPKVDWQGLAERVRVHDPGGRLAHLGYHGASFAEWDGAETTPVIVATRWSEGLGAAWREGARIVYLEGGGGGWPVQRGPFWREAMKLFSPHPVWERFPHDGWTDLRFYGLTPDAWLERDGLRAQFPGVERRDVLTRVDARATTVGDYAVELRSANGGRVLATTLRPDGGLGDTPPGLWRNVAGGAFLAAAIEALAVAEDG